MKYIFRNIFNFIQDNTKFFFIVLVTLFLSSVIIHTTYGIYRGYEIKKINARNSTDRLSIVTTGNYQIDENIVSGPGGYSNENKVSFSASPSDSQITVSDLKKFLSALGNKFDDIILNIRAFAVVGEDYYVCDFSERDGRIVNNHDYALENLNESRGSVLNSFQSGRFFSDSEYENGDKVCIAYGFKNKLKGQFNKKKFKPRRYIKNRWQRLQNYWHIQYI